MKKTSDESVARPLMDERVWRGLADVLIRTQHVQFHEHSSPTGEEDLDAARRWIGQMRLWYRP